ncbi:MAG: hypothetical protein ACR2H1_08185, partial [Limisphaerales bacterium]
MKTKKTKIRPFIKNSALAFGDLVAATSVPGSTDYGPARWTPPCNANYYTSGFGHKCHVLFVFAALLMASAGIKADVSAVKGSAYGYS